MTNFYKALGLGVPSTFISESPYCRLTETLKRTSLITQMKTLRSGVFM